jgi:hypothetical protein
MVERRGGFDLTDVWGVDTSVAVHMVKVFAMVAGCRRYPDSMGYGKQFEVLARMRRNEDV